LCSSDPGAAVTDPVQVGKKLVLVNPNHSPKICTPAVGQKAGVERPRKSTSIMSGEMVPLGSIFSSKAEYNNFMMMMSRPRYVLLLLRCGQWVWTQLLAEALDAGRCTY
jgi:hypothetical protein